MSIIKIYLVLGMSLMIAVSCSFLDTSIRGSGSEPLDPCETIPTNLSPGTFNLSETFKSGKRKSDCWSTESTSYSFMPSSSLKSKFSDEIFTSGGLKTSRKLSIDFVNGMETNSTVDYSPYSTPDTGWDSGQWPYVMDLINEPNCYSDVTMSVQNLTAGQGGAAHLYGLVLNGSFEGTGADKKFTGYLMLVNDGGNWVSMTRFSSAPEHFSDYLDNFPNHPTACGGACINPLIDGPYKGWDLHLGPNGINNGGGHPSTAEIVLAARYSYNENKKESTVEWELRHGDATDDSPNAWHHKRVLTGSDAIAPSGKFGFFVVYYGAIGTTQGTSNFSTSFSNFKLSCEN